MRVTLGLKKVMPLLCMLCLSAIALLLIKGCGGGETAASTGSIAFIPSAGYSYSGLTANTCAEFTVVAFDNKANPLHNINITITGSFAVPRTPVSHYQFYNAAGCNNPGATGIPVNSGFTVSTGDSGGYAFSALVTIATGTFSDNIQAFSGIVNASAKLESQ
jgi:hypothetical protein